MELNKCVISLICTENKMSKYKKFDGSYNSGCLYCFSGHQLFG